ncbi:MAG: hypothetical protein LBQ10_10565, partial [Desulfovibrio sp.]|nr:hypothetical protein [Desulfovibrio sp.]
MRLSLDGEVNSPCDNLAARICEQILAERFIYFQCELNFRASEEKSTKIKAVTVEKAVTVLFFCDHFATWRRKKNLQSPLVFHIDRQFPQP